MSLLYSKQTISKTDLIESLTLILKPRSQQDFDLACQYLGSLMKKHAKELFNRLRQKNFANFVEPTAENLLNILFVIHSNIEEESIAKQLREPAIYWLQKVLAENKESFTLMLNEVSTPGLQSIITKSNIIPKSNQQIAEKRISQLEIQNHAIKPQFQVESYQIKPKIFCVIYYSYLQKISINLSVYKSIKSLQYPFDEQEDTKGKFIWIYKIQNMMLMGLKLLECQSQVFKFYQDFIYQNMIQFLIFIRQEIEYLIDQYAIISNLDCLSLYEIYIEFLRAQTIVEKYCSDIDLKIRLNTRQIEDFLNFSVRIRVLNQSAFKKSLKVAGRHQANLSGNQMEDKHQKVQNFFNKENMDEPHLRDYHEQLSDETQVTEKRYENKSRENEVYLEVDSHRLTHIRGVSTFQQS
ncbi:unnamed protein product (macronuclear) [Paramecium tetraurelia]|uniref:Uncharacterized protein n=1 Tax=Paramecium tetraurelia TaxID=5888 RepID=A0DDT7_PARTE|nr:uncharacterized protein GSPATT00016045001 [Paramecium tetraurelia]CAK81204.1 unnamed protein product [Paramecium tetraurelia]|eukprot:XP_001448601.1 hypothetical protein (macronuclear) [Paramecium tetraurelia strain d4-2]